VITLLVADLFLINNETYIFASISYLKKNHVSSFKGTS